VAGDFASGTGRLWWVAIERLIARNDAVEATMHGKPVRFETSTPADKEAAFVAIQNWLRGMNSNWELRSAVTELCERYCIDETGIARELCLSWPELKQFAADPLVTIGAHTMSHCNLAKATAEEAEGEVVASRALIEAELGGPVQHLAYPYGDRTAAAAREFTLTRNAGFKTAVTTRPGMIFAENAEHMTALPRLSLNGNYQYERLLPVLTSGAATAMWNGFRRVDAA
jgi:peptidoglycan/xylan/chitin deacetylase (PgdA/CDA1 family)